MADPIEPVVQEPVAPNPDAPPLAVAEPAVAAAAPAGDAPPPAQPQEPAAPEQPKWALDRIDKMTKEKYALQQQLDALRAAASPAVPADPTAPAFDPEKYNRDVEAAAARRSDANAYAERCNKIALEGAKEFPDFQAQVAALNTLQLFSPDFVGAIETVPGTKPHELIQLLGKDLNEASRIASLGPAQQGIALMQFAQAKKTPPKRVLSGAPEPAPAIVGGGGTGAEGLDDSLPMDEWMRRRDAEDLKARGAIA